MERINIVGAGLSGLSAAIALAERGVASNLISAQPSERAQSVLAEGGINAALDTMGEDDTTSEHFADTMQGGVYLADPNAVAGLTAHAPGIVTWLAALGVPFQTEVGRLILRNFGGQKKKRTAYAKSSTGKAIMTALIDAARKYEAAGLVYRFPHHEFLCPVLAEGRCAGAEVRDAYTDTLYFCPGPVILAAGGLNGLFPGRTTGTAPNTGDACAAAFALGAELGNPEMIQYHPTTAGIPGKRMLVSEAARGEGGRLYIERNGAPWFFMEEKYPELGNLMPRDVVSREMTLVRALPDCGDQVYLDLTGLPADTWRRKLSDMREEIRHYLALDPVKTPVPVSPGIHFFMGGLLVDEGHRTNLPRLFAAGECACQYHGANRLGGNSMLAAIYGGRVAAESAAQTADENGLAEPETLGPLPEDRRRALTVSPAFPERLAGILWDGLGILRDGASIAASLDRLETLLSEPLTVRERRRALLGRAMLLSALAREESRGAHTRTDFPERDDARFQKTTVAACRDGEVRISFRDIPARRVEA